MHDKSSFCENTTTISLVKLWARRIGLLAGVGGGVEGDLRSSEHPWRLQVLNPRAGIKKRLLLLRGVVSR